MSRSINEPLYQEMIIVKNFAAIFLALAHGLEKKGVLTRKEFAQHMEEHWVKMIAERAEAEEELAILRSLIFILNDQKPN